MGKRPAQELHWYRAMGGVAQGGGVPWPGIKGAYSDKKKQGYNDWQGSDLGDLRKPGSV